MGYEPLALPAAKKGDGVSRTWNAKGASGSDKSFVHGMPQGNVATVRRTRANQFR